MYEGDALAWFQWTDSRRPITLWAELKGLLINRFRSTLWGSAWEQLLALRHEGTIREYRHSFEILSSSLGDLVEKV